MTIDSEASSVLIYSLNIGVFLFGVSAGAAVRLIFANKKVRPIRWGGICLLVLNVFLGVFMINHMSNFPLHEATGGVHQFNNGVSMGERIGAVIFPGLAMLCLIWLYVRIKAGRIVHRVESANDMNSSRVIAIGNKIATVIFWIIGGGFLLVLLLALLLGH